MRSRLCGLLELLEPSRQSIPIGAILLPPWQLDHLPDDPLEAEFEKRAIMDFEKPIGNVNSVIGVPRLPDVAHIIMDAEEQPGQPIVSNGLPLTKLHHAAFDAHLIGIDPDYRIHVSDRLLEIHDGPFLELGLKGIAGTLIKLPRRSDDRPDRDRLARRFEEFKKTA